MLVCRCHGFSGSCAVRTCWRELPSYYQIGDMMKIKYDHALKVSVERNRNGPAFLHFFDETLNAYLEPTPDQLVYLEKPSNYCSNQQNFTQNRECLPKALLDFEKRGQVKTAAMREYFPPCEEFCCNGEYVQEQTYEIETCNCEFVWCCNVVCQSCVVNMTYYRCTG